MLKATLRHLLSDGQGLQTALNWKGASALRACWCHWNVIKKASAVVDYAPELVDITCSDASLFKKQSDRRTSDSIALVEAASRRFEAGLITKTMFENICMSRGLTYNRCGVLWDPATRPMIKQRTARIDWVHSCLCDGTLSCELHLILEAADAKVGKGFNAVAQFLKMAGNSRKVEALLCLCCLPYSMTFVMSIVRIMRS